MGLKLTRVALIAIFLYFIVSTLAQDTKSSIKNVGILSTKEIEEQLKVFHP
jgi:hypothetical protein